MTAQEKCPRSADTLGGRRRRIQLRRDVEAIRLDLATEAALDAENERRPRWAK